MNANAHLQRLPFNLTVECLDNLQSCAHGPPRVIFMGAGIAEINE
jgi:hypothetical protein